VRSCGWFEDGAEACGNTVCVAVTLAARIRGFVPEIDEMGVGERDRSVVKCRANGVGDEMRFLVAGATRPGADGEEDFGAGLGACRPVTDREGSP
jgi:hypothetical protein